MSDVEPPPALINPDTGLPAWVPTQQGVEPQAEKSDGLQPGDEAEDQTGEDSAFEHPDTVYDTDDTADQTAQPSPRSSDTRANSSARKTAIPSRSASARDSSDNQTKADSTTTNSPAALKPGQNKDGALNKYALIIDKNLFSPERKKWVSPPAGGKQVSAQIAQKTMDDLILFGTIISPEGRYAVLRTKQTRKSKQDTGGFQPYTTGDYIAGYLIKEIDAKKVTLLDESEDQEYTVFINDDKKVRRVEKTALKAAAPKPVTQPVKRRSAAKRRLPKKQPAAPAPPAGAWGRGK